MNTRAQNNVTPPYINSLFTKARKANEKRADTDQRTHHPRQNVTSANNYCLISNTASPHTVGRRILSSNKDSCSPTNSRSFSKRFSSTATFDLSAKQITQKERHPVLVSDAFPVSTMHRRISRNIKQLKRQGGASGSVPLRIYPCQTGKGLPDGARCQDRRGRISLRMGLQSERDVSSGAATGHPARRDA